MIHTILALIDECISLSEEERIRIYNASLQALQVLVADISPDPALGVQLLPAAKVLANDYNPNHVAAPEIALLAQSIEHDGVTMPVVVVRDENTDTWVVVDGFHRQKVLREDCRRQYIPCSVIKKSIQERMASTIRHNRARGKHQVDLMGEIVKALSQLGCDDAKIASDLGMSADELLRLRQLVGAAACLASSEYSLSWGNTDEPDHIYKDSQ